MDKDLAWFDPRTRHIGFDLVGIKQCPKWRRQLLALLVHELTHVWEYFCLYRQDLERWNMGNCARADHAQDMVLRVLRF